MPIKIHHEYETRRNNLEEQFSFKSETNLPIYQGYLVRSQLKREKLLLQHKHCESMHRWVLKNPFIPSVKCSI